MMTNINGFVTSQNCTSDCSPDEPFEMYLCGDHLIDKYSDPITGEYEASVAVLNSTGEILSYLTISGANAARLSNN